MRRPPDLDVYRLYPLLASSPPWPSSQKRKCVCIYDWVPSRLARPRPQLYNCHHRTHAHTHNGYRRTSKKAKIRGASLRSSHPRHINGTNDVSGTRAVSRSAYNNLPIEPPPRMSSAHILSHTHILPCIFYFPEKSPSPVFPLSFSRCSSEVSSSPASGIIHEKNPHPLGNGFFLSLIGHTVCMYPWMYI